MGRQKPYREETPLQEAGAAGPLQARWQERYGRERAWIAILLLLIALALSLYIRVAIEAAVQLRQKQSFARIRFTALMAAEVLEHEAGPIPASFMDRRQDDGTAVWVADLKGGVLLPVSDNRSVAGYGPFQRALAGDVDAVSAKTPDGVPAVVGYAMSRRAGKVVLVAQPDAATFGAMNLLIRLLSFVLIPLLALLLPTVWILAAKYQHERMLAVRLEEQNERLRAADRAKSDFLANVSHDLRTPLTAMRLSISGLLDPAVRWNAAQARETLRMANEEIDHLTARVRNLLDMARLEGAPAADRRQICDMTDIACSALERVRPLLGERPICAEFPPEPLLVECDQAQFEKVVVNLLENAAKYTPERSAIYLRGGRKNGQVSLTVRDEGPGIPPGHEERIFDKYYRAAPDAPASGTGLGLAICRAVTEQHGGRIRARNMPGGGAAFEVELPALT